MRFGFGGSVDVSTWYADTDRDAYGDVSSSDVDCCRPTGYTADATDCDDTDATQYPGAGEYCNGEDDDCDGVTDPTGSDGNLGANPAFTAYTDDGDNTNDDLSLGATSVCIDAGNPSEEHRGQHFAEYGTVGVMSTMPDPFRGAHEWSYPAFVDLIGHVVSAASAPPAPQPPPRIARMTPTAGRMGPGRAVFQQETSSVFVDGAFEGIRAE